MNIEPASSERRHQAILDLAALDKSDLEVVLRRILEADADSLQIERCSCWAFEQSSGAIRCVSGFVRSSRTHEQGEVLYERDIPRYFRALAEDPIILADDARGDPRTAELTEGYLVPMGITSMLDVPIWVRGRLWGVVCHEHVGPPRLWEESERDFAMSIGHIVSMAIESHERADAERTVRFSEFFVGVLSHDLRNPLSTIEGSAQLIVSRQCPAGCEKEAERILRSAQRMSRMVEQLLDFTRIRIGGGLPIRRQQVDLADVTHRIVADLATAHPERAIDVQVEGNPNGSWDPDRLWQLVSNLAINAIEHGSDHQPVWIRIDGTASDLVAVQVGNKGTVPPSLVPTIFEPFHRADRESSPKGGLGLGLFIAREIVAAHDGAIEVDASADQTVFRFRLPRGEA